ncbi:MAG: hypothetical protein JWN04_3169 [Myxococcaceae bacterium]|nr:hypothetical protein [Myxococcaceae bacterium]
MKKIGLAFLLAASAAFSMQCAAVEEETQELEASSAALDNVGATLGNGVRTTIASVTGAENLLFTSTERLLITSDHGVFELRKNAGGSFDRTTILEDQTALLCTFTGIVESRATLYTTCRGTTQSFLFASPVASTLSFRVIYTLSGYGFANGLATDETGRLFVATSFQNKILRLSPSDADPLSITRLEVYQTNAGTFVNGLAYHGGSIYWSDTSFIKRNASDGVFATFKLVVAELGYFDDLRVDDAGILAADSTSNVLRAYTLSGSKTGQTRQLFDGPSSVARALGRAGFSQNAIVVTERRGNRVSVFEPR